MLRTLKMFVCLFIGILIAFGATHKTIAYAPVLPIMKIVSMQELIRTYALQFNVSPTSLLAVANCESGLNDKAWNRNDPNGGSKGILQFQETTFSRYSKEIGIQNPDIWNPEQQAEVGAYMFSLHQQNQWSCWKIINRIHQS